MLSCKKVRGMSLQICYHLSLKVNYVRFEFLDIQNLHLFVESRISTY